MTTFYTDEENDKNNEQANQPLTQTTAAPATTSGQGASQPQGTSPSATRKPSASGRFVDVGKYYEAGRDKAQQVQQQVAGGLSGKAEEAKSRFDTGVQNYAKSRQGYNYDPSVFTGKGAEDVDPDQFRNIFNDRLIGNYIDDGGYQDYRKSAKAIGDTATAGGRAQALRNIAAGGYSSGENKLDSFLLNKAERENSVLGNLRNQYATPNVDDQITASQQQAEAAKQATVEQRAAVRKQAEDYLAKQRASLFNEARASSERETAAARNQYTADLQKAWENELATKRSALETTLNTKRNDELERYKAANPFSAPLETARAGSLNLPAAQAQGTPLTQYSADFNLTGPKNFQEALAALATKGFGDQAISRRPDLEPQVQQRLDAYNNLRGIARVGEGIDLGQNQVIDRAVAEQALRDLVTFGGIKQTVTSGGNRPTMPGFAGGKYVMGEDGKPVEVKNETLTARGETQEQGRARAKKEASADAPKPFFSEELTK